MIVTRAPTRIDFGGGWTDVPPYSNEVGGFVCNVAISRYATIRITPNSGGDPSSGASEIVVQRPGDRALMVAALARLGVRGVSVELRNDFPVGAGLGGSSAAGVAVVTALCQLTDRALERNEIAEASREIETSELGIAGGRQDHYAAAFGGALGLRFHRDVTVTPIPLGDDLRRELARRCLVIYTGQSRISATTITSVLGAFTAGDAKVNFALRQMRELAERMPGALARGDLDELGALVAEQWSHQRTLDPAIPTPQIDAIIERARDAGSCGAKALGASGGGCVLVVAREHNVDEIRAAIAPMGELIDYEVDQTGVTSCA